jgi:predicted transcriptional regulator
MTPEAFKQFRLDLGFKRQKDLAEVLELHTTTISKLEAGVNPISQVMRYALFYLAEMRKGKE